MQLTNIARDVGEDARMGRVYLPHDWLEEEGVDVEALRARPAHTRQLGRVIARLLAEARRLYIRSEAGISRLPLRCRPAMFACREIYAAIGQEVARNRHNSIDQRAYTKGGQKLRLVGRAVVRAGLSSASPQDATLYAAPLPEVAYLVEAAAHPDHAAPPDRLDRFLNVMADLERWEQTRAAV
jgi:phytoene synthase